MTEQTTLRKQSEEKIGDTTEKSQLVGKKLIITSIISNIPTKNGPVNVYSATLPDGSAVQFFGSKVMDAQNVKPGKTVVTIGTGPAANGDFFKFYLPE